MDYESTEITHHYTEAIKLLKSRVTNLEVATSDGTIGAILFMLTYTVSSKQSAATDIVTNFIRI